MYFGLSTSLSAAMDVGVKSVSTPEVFNMLGQRDGFAIDFISQRMLINDAGNPINNFNGDPIAKLTKWGVDDFTFDPVKGLEINAARDFSIALDTTLFPYNPSACTIFVKYRLNASVSSEQRYLMMVDNAGTDRLANYAVAGQNFRFVSGDGASADVALSDLTAVPDTEYTAVFGVDLNGKTYVDDAGIHSDNSATLSAATPSHFGIGGYPDRVLRVLDGFISEIVVICEPVEKEERLTLSLSAPHEANLPDPNLPVFDVLGVRDGFAIDFVARQMKINDANTAENSFLGDPEEKLTNFGSDGFEYDPVKGLKIDALRDFSIGLSTSVFPFNPNAAHIYAKYSVNSSTSPEQRYLFMTDNAGDDRFALYAVSGQPFRFVSGDGTGPDVVLSSMDFIADTEHTVVIGADANGKTYIDEDGVQADTSATLSTSTPAHVGIGGYNDRVLRVLDGYITEIAVITEPIQTEARLTLEPFYTIYKAEGDSHTFNTNEATWGVSPSQFYAQRVADALGPRVISVNYGWSGDSSAEMVHQLPAFSVDGRPDIATIYAGANDGPISIINDTVPTSSQFSVTHSLRTRLEPGGFVEVNGEKGRVAARDGNLITLEGPLLAAPQVGETISPDTQANIEHWIDEVSATGVSKIAVIGYHLMNFSTGGDTPTYEHPNRVAIRDKQKAAAASRGVPYIDTYAHMAGKISFGEVTAGDDLSWHVAVGNTHLNVAGEQAVADAVYDAFVALGWD